MFANQGMDVVSALKLSEQAKGIGLQWFEEPVPHTDFAGYELLRQKCGIALAMGEREYDCEALKNLIARNALDLWQPDLIRLGGVEEFMNEVADYLKDNNIRVKQVNLLPYHNTGMHKYRKLDRAYDEEELLTVPGKDRMELFKNIFVNKGFSNTKIGG